MYGSGFFSKSFFGGGFFGPAPFTGDSEPWGVATKESTSTILENLPDQTLIDLKKKRAIIEKIELLRNPYLPELTTIDNRISEGLMREKLAEPVELAPDIALMIAIAEACDD